MARPERPLLVAASGTPETFRLPPGGGGGTPRNPGKARQTVRLEPAFEALANALAGRRGALQADASGSMLEQVLVIETNGTVKELYEVVASTPGRTRATLAALLHPGLVETVSRLRQTSLPAPGRSNRPHL